jgi:hypothetical protein
LIRAVKVRCLIRLGQMLEVEVEPVGQPLDTISVGNKPMQIEKPHLRQRLSAVRLGSGRANYWLAY